MEPINKLPIRKQAINILSTRRAERKLVKTIQLGRNEETGDNWGGNTFRVLEGNDVIGGVSMSRGTNEYNERMLFDMKQV